jgi:hypothetical protein
MHHYGGCSLASLPGGLSPRTSSQALRLLYDRAVASGKRDGMDRHA